MILIAFFNFMSSAIRWPSRGVMGVRSVMQPPYKHVSFTFNFMKQGFQCPIYVYIQLLKPSRFNLQSLNLTHFKDDLSFGYFVGDSYKVLSQCLQNLPIKKISITAHFFQLHPAANVKILKEIPFGSSRISFLQSLVERLHLLCQEQKACNHVAFLSAPCNYAKFSK